MMGVVGFIVRQPPWLIELIPDFPVAANATFP